LYLGRVFFDSPKFLRISHTSLAHADFAGTIIKGDEDKKQLRWCDQLTKHCDGLSVTDAIDDQGLPRFPTTLH